MFSYKPFFKTIQRIIIIKGYTPDLSFFILVKQSALIDC